MVKTMVKGYLALLERQDFAMLLQWNFFKVKQKSYQTATKSN